MNVLLRKWPSKWLARRSIATRLFLSAAFWSGLILLVAGLSLSAIHRQASERDFDERLGVYLRALVAALTVVGDDPKPELGQLGEPMFELPLSGWYWQVTRLDATPPDLKASRSLFTERLPNLADNPDSTESNGSRRGYSKGPDGQRLRAVERLIDAGDQGRYLIEVAATPIEMEADIARFDVYLGATFSILALALVASSALQVRFGLRPLRRLQQGVGAIRRGESEKIEGNFPRDIFPLASELNLLISSNREIVSRARTHVGNLAHALKTPLSVIVNEADANRSGPSADLSEKVREQAGIMRDQVNYYLDRARAAARTSMIGTATDIEPVIDGLVRTFGKIYRDRSIAISVQAQPGARFRGERQDLEDLVGNLIDNACKWTRGRVSVSVKRVEDLTSAVPNGTVITVDDDGPGLPPDERSLAMRRGRRLDETKPGSGLGLSIVADLASAYGGAFELGDSPLGGLRAKLRLP